MTNEYNFNVRISTSDLIEEDVAAEVLQKRLSNLKTKDHINFVTIDHSTIEEDEIDRLFEMVKLVEDRDIQNSIEFVGQLTE